MSELPPDLQDKVDAAVEAMRRDEAARLTLSVEFLAPVLRSTDFRNQVMHLAERDLGECTLREVHVILDSALLILIRPTQQKD